MRPSRAQRVGIMLLAAMLLALVGCGGSGSNAGRALSTIILVDSKQDIGQTRMFTVPDRWAISWHYQGCTKIPRVPYLQIAIYLPSNDIVRIAVRDYHGPSHRGYQVEQGAGTYYLGVSSTCPWTMRILATSRPTQPNG